MKELAPIVERALWLAYLAGWAEAVENNDYGLLDEDQKQRLVAKFKIWLKERIDA